MKKNISFYFLTGLLFFISLGFYTSIQAWTPPFRLTWNTGGSDGGVIAVDSLNRIHIVWVDDVSGNHELYYKNNTVIVNIWSATKRLTWNSGTTIQPDIAVDSNDMIHLVYIDNTTYPSQIYYKTSVNAGLSWSAPKRLTYTSAGSYQPQIVVDSANNLHMVFIDDSFSGDYGDMFYKKSTDGGITWSALQRLTWTGNYSSLPALAIDNNDNLHLVWRENVLSNWELYYKKSTSMGGSWSNVQRITWTPTPSNMPHICTDQNNWIHVMWVDRESGRDQIYYKKSIDNAVTWTAPQRLIWDNWACSRPFIIAASGNVLHATWYKYISSTNPEIFYKMSNDAGNTWSALSRLTWNTHWSAYPKIALDSSNVPHMVWTESISNNREIFYRHK